MRVGTVEGDGEGFSGEVDVWTDTLLLGVAVDPVATELTEPGEVRAEGGNTDPQAVTLFERILSESPENTARTPRTTWKMGLEAHSTPPNP